MWKVKECVGCPLENIENEDLCLEHCKEITCWMSEHDTQLKLEFLRLCIEGVQNFFIDLLHKTKDLNDDNTELVLMINKYVCEIIERQSK